MIFLHIFLSAALIRQVAALIVKSPVLEIKHIDDQVRHTDGQVKPEEERYAYTAAEYVSCHVRSRATDTFFDEEVSLSYEVPEGVVRSRELKFLAPLPPSARVVRCDMELDGEKYGSKVYARFQGDEIYDKASETETIAEVMKIDDLIYFRMKVPEGRMLREIEIKMVWQQNPGVVYQVQQAPERMYVFPRKAYFKYGSTVLRDGASYVGKDVRFEFRIDFSGTCGWNIECEDNYDEEDGVYRISDKGEDDIVFRMKMERDPGMSARSFEFDGHEVVELLVEPKGEEVQKAMVRTREVILVVDKSGSMGFGNEGKKKPYELVTEAIKVFLSMAAALKIHVNVVFFNLKSGEGDVLFREGSKVVSEEEILKNKEWVEGKAEPSGGTNILEGLRQAVGLEPTKNLSMGRSVILLTDGGDGNLDGIKRLVTKKAKKGTRFFSIGIGNEVSSDVVQEVSRLGQGAHAFVRDAYEIGPCFVAMLEKTGAQRFKNREFVGLDVDEGGITQHIEGGRLKELTRPVLVPSKQQMPDLFVNERAVMYVVFKKGEVPERIKIKLDDGVEYEVEKKDFKKCKGGGTESELAHKTEREFAHVVEREFYAELYEEYDKKMRESKVVKNKSEDARLDYEDVVGVIPDGDKLWKKYKEQIRFVMNNHLLTADTALMLGDGLENKNRDDWEQKDIEPIIKQYIKNYSEKEEEIMHSFMSRNVLYGASLDVVDSVHPGPRLGIAQPGTPSKADTPGTSPASECLSTCSLLFEFERHAKDKTDVLVNALAELLVRCGEVSKQEKALAQIRGELKRIEQMADRPEHARKELLCALIEEFLKTNDKVNATLVTCMRIAIAN